MYSVTEQLIVWLVEHGYTASTYPRKDATPPFITVERTGGHVADLVDHPTMAVQTWAVTEAEAEEMAIAIRDALLLSTLPRGVHSVRVNAGPYPFWDEATRYPRYQTVFDFTTQLTE